MRIEQMRLGSDLAKTSAAILHGCLRRKLHRALFISQFLTRLPAGADQAGRFRVVFHGNFLSQLLPKFILAPRAANSHAVKTAMLFVWRAARSLQIVIDMARARRACYS